MARVLAVLVLSLALSLALLAGCKSMGGVASGLGHAASAAGHVASGFGSVASHAAAGMGKVMAPVASGVSRAASSAKVAGQALEIAETVGEAVVASALNSSGNDDVEGVDVSGDQVPNSSLPPPAGDLCLDCPDVGNCSSCTEPRFVP